MDNAKKKTKKKAYESTKKKKIDRSCYFFYFFTYILLTHYFPTLSFSHFVELLFFFPIFTFRLTHILSSSNKGLDLLNCTSI